MINVLETYYSGPKLQAAASSPQHLTPSRLNREKLYVPTNLQAIPEEELMLQIF